MKVCTVCGCYIPDNWTKCPACSALVNTEFVQKSTQYERYVVDVHYNSECDKINFRKTFVYYELALNYVHAMSKNSDILIISLWDRDKPNVQKFFHYTGT